MVSRSLCKSWSYALPGRALPGLNETARAQATRPGRPSGSVTGRPARTHCCRPPRRFSAVSPARRRYLAATSLRSRSADHDDRPVAVELVETRRQLPEGNVARAGDAAGGPLVVLADVENLELLAALVQCPGIHGGPSAGG